jgi:hypothetical protein
VEWPSFCLLNEYVVHTSNWETFDFWLTPISNPPLVIALILALYSSVIYRAAINWSKVNSTLSEQLIDSIPFNWAKKGKSSENVWNIYKNKIEMKWITADAIMQSIKPHPNVQPLHQ